MSNLVAAAALQSSQSYKELCNVVHEPEAEDECSQGAAAQLTLTLLLDRLICWYYHVKMGAKCCCVSCLAHRLNKLMRTCP